VQDLRSKWTKGRIAQVKERGAESAKEEGRFRTGSNGGDEKELR